MTKRKPLSKRTRFRIFARDGFKCRYCGKSSAHVVLVVDHVIPVAEGGTDDDENLITACEPCNQGKAAKRLEQFMPTADDALKLAQERNEQRRAAIAAQQIAEARRELRQTVVDVWCEIRHTEEVDARTIATMVRYVEKYGLARVAGWIEIAHAKNPRDPDYRIGMYVSGVRRGMLEQGTLEPAEDD
jgi:hypothetical protein